MASCTTGVSRELSGGATSDGEQTPFAGNREHQDTATAQSHSGKHGGLGSNLPVTPKGGPTLRLAATGSGQGGDAGSLAMKAIARSMINGAQITKAQVKAWMESVRLQLETNTFDPAILPAIIDGYKDKGSDFEDTTRESQQRLAARVRHGDLPEGARGGVR